MIARLLHGFTDRLPSLRCCGKRWNDLPRHRSFAHGETVVIPERDELAHLRRPGGFVAEDMGTGWSQGPTETFRCFCGAPAVGWVYQVMGDGQTINGLAVCAAHQEEQP